MSHCIKSTHSSTGPMKGACHNFSSHTSTVHHKVHHGDSHKKGHHETTHSSLHGGFHKGHHVNSHLSHHGGHYRAPSVHGGSGGKGISISKHTSIGHGFGFGSAHTHSSHHSFGGHSGWKAEGLFAVNEKETMQCLNDRLASYLEKVRSLEQENSQLERNIREWYDRNQPSTFPDFSCFFRTIQELQSQVSRALFTSLYSMIWNVFLMLFHG